MLIFSSRLERRLEVDGHFPGPHSSSSCLNMLDQTTDSEPKTLIASVPDLKSVAFAGPLSRDICFYGIFTPRLPRNCFVRNRNGEELLIFSDTIDDTLYPLTVDLRTGKLCLCFQYITSALICCSFRHHHRPHIEPAHRRAVIQRAVGCRQSQHAVFSSLVTLGEV